MTGLVRSGVLFHVAKALALRPNVRSPIMLRTSLSCLALFVCVAIAPSAARAQPVALYEPDTQVVVVEQAPPPRVQLVQAVPPAQRIEIVQAPPRLQLVQAPPTRPARSTLRYVVSGFFAGGLAGLGAGYLATDRGHASEAWRGLVLGSGIGALTGAGLGVALAILDASSDRQLPPGRYVMRDAAYGTLLGAALGATVGGLVALETHDGSDALFGASIGGLSGFALGAVIGVLEGRWRGRRYDVAGALSMQSDVAGRRALGPALVGRF